MLFEGLEYQAVGKFWGNMPSNIRTKELNLISEERKAKEFGEQEERLGRANRANSSNMPVPLDWRYR